AGVIDKGSAATHADPRTGPGTRAPLPGLVDARIRVITTALACTAALVAASLLGAALVVAACVAVVVVTRIERSRLVLATRPLIALAILLVGLQMLLGGDADVDIRRGVASGHHASPAVLRTLQA